MCNFDDAYFEALNNFVSCGSVDGARDFHKNNFVIQNKSSFGDQLLEQIQDTLALDTQYEHLFGFIDSVEYANYVLNTQCDVYFCFEYDDINYIYYNR